MRKIAVASGKGGTGKTTVSVSLYHYLSKQYNNRIRLIDCDVEEPNVILFFDQLEKKGNHQVYNLLPKIDTTLCTFCKKCAEWCEFNAISIVKNLGFAEVNKDLCHSCGACSHACTFQAITEHKQLIGEISYFNNDFGAGITEGRLEIGSAMQTSLIKEVKQKDNIPDILALFDSPPGTSCPVVETISDADYVILVTEPTPFGLHDLKITVELLNEIQIPFSVVVNKSGLGNKQVYDYLENQNIELLGRIPFSREYAKNYSKGKLFENIPEEIETAYQKIVKKLTKKIKAG